MGSKVIVKRLYDYEVVLGTMDAVWDSISENGIEKYKPDLLGEYWLGLFLDDEYLGMYRFHSLTSICLEGHVFMLPEKRDHSLSGGYAVMKWLVENLSFRKVIVNIPECFPNVIDFVRKLGFVEQGYNSNAWSRDVIHGIYQFGILSEDMKWAE